MTSNSHRRNSHWFMAHCTLHQNNVLKNIDLTISESEMAKLGDKELTRLRLDKMGFIFQQMYMMKNLSMLDNIILPAIKSKKNRSSHRQTEERGRVIMHRLGIDDVCSNDINEVSGGQLQRACICRSMINSPKIIFADEPTGALNRSNSDKVMNELLSLNRDGTTIMCVTHDPKVPPSATGCCISWTAVSSVKKGFTMRFLPFLSLRSTLKYANFTLFLKFYVTQRTHCEDNFLGRDWGHRIGSSQKQPIH